MVFDDVVPEVALYAPFAPDLVIERALAETARHFFRHTTAWRIVVEVPLAAGVADAAPTLPAGAVIADVVASTWDGRPLRSATDAQTLTQREVVGNPALLEQPTPTALKVSPAPAQAGTLVALVALAPAFAATGIPDTLMEEFADALKYGAAARVLRMPGTEWRDERAANLYLGLYMAEVEAGKLRADRATTRKVREVQYGGL